MSSFALLISGASCLALGFVGLTVSVVAAGSPVKRFDERAMAAIVRRRSDRSDRIMTPLSTLATMEPLAVQGIVAFAVLLVTLEGAPLLQFALAAVGSGLLTRLAKTVVARPRPTVPHLIRWVRGSSYPSGDLLTASSIYGTLVLIAAPHLPPGAGAWVLSGIVAGLISLLACCRVYVGVHHPSDVAAGMLLGSAWTLFIAAWFA